MAELDTAEKKLLKQTKFPEEFSKKVDTRKVEKDVIKRYVSLSLSTSQHLLTLATAG
jgi:hypothetical protein